MRITRGTWLIVGLSITVGIATGKSTTAAEVYFVLMLLREVIQELN